MGFPSAALHDFAVDSPVTAAGPTRSYDCPSCPLVVSAMAAASAMSRTSTRDTTADPTVPVPPVTSMLIDRSYTTRGPRSPLRSSADLAPHLRGRRARGVLE